MIVSHKSMVEEIEIDNVGVKNAFMKVLISPKEGWEGYVMRSFKLKPGGFTPKHDHPWPHINYIISGNGTLHLDGKDNSIESGSFAYVPAGKTHQFMNISNTDLEFICIVPEEGHK
ncbi:cupin domain-containing protein [Clostridium aestuarii]|uniref:Cupin domain-containing protein n=1 Tax=Clostridium aestuarii TaxID=338193 RepID=A0ABT4D2P1_9CLOT|nr:cupin domain-containing protein [Clostridium aestuarii]MCY6485520.1 cupin domain-containing protein [Clostridium aestuarii]